MTKPWVHVTRTCPTGKLRYRDEYDAERDMKRIRARGEREGDTYVPAEAYACQICSGWHLSSSKSYRVRSSANRPGSRERRRRWRAALTVELLGRAPGCQVRTSGCEGRAIDIRPLSRPDLRNPGAWVTVCGTCRETHPKETP